jgi:hypothetical protein
MVRAHQIGRKARYEDYIHSLEWRKLRAEKLAVSPVCELCGTPSRLHIHHLKYAHLHDVELKHLMTLCEAHHAWAHTLAIKDHLKASTKRRLILRQYK